MIFDPQRTAELERQYPGVSFYEGPRMVRLTLNPDLASEREYLEATLLCAAEGKRKRWLGELLNGSEGQHYGAWFEMMLYGWLKQVGPVEIEPDVRGDKPDFAVTAGDQRIVVEAEALTIGEEEQERKEYVSKLVCLLNASPEPYEVYILDVANKTLYPDQELADKMLEGLKRAWMTAEDGPLDDGGQCSEEDRERYRDVRCVDRYGSEVLFCGRPKEGTEGTEAFPAEVEFMDSFRVWQKLGDKLGQHKALRQAGYPYIIAMLLDTEAMMLDEDAVAEALFGRPGAAIDQNAARLVDWQWDRSGVLFLDGDRDVRHVDLSGVLAFDAWLNVSARRRELRAWYIQNPYATAPVGVCLFPAKDRHIVLHEGRWGYRVGWASRKGPGFSLPPMTDKRGSGG